VKQKGSALKSLFSAIENLYGAPSLRAVIDALPNDVRSEVAGPILPVGWYETRLFSAIHVAVRDVLGKGDWTVSHALGREAGRIDFTGVYRLVLRAVQYDTIWDRIELAWKQYNSHGEARWIERQSGSAIGLIRGVDGFNHGQWHSIAGRCEQLLLLGGAKGATVEPLDLSPTQARCSAIYIE
jgi:hypothetical protein